MILGPTEFAIILFLYLIGFFSSLSAFVYYSFKADKWKYFWAILFLGYVVTYLISVIHLYKHPFWYDNDVLEEIKYPDHYLWAVISSSIVQFVIIPLAAILATIAMKFSTKTGYED